eukprot:NODE_309_length_11266_cov_0.459479.p2 type:complete len:270 gc:universal NODE_309_length_11266_cov_0.459479:5669-6478(+)
MLLTTLTAGLVTPSALDLQKFSNVRFDSTSLALSGDLACAIEYAGHVKCWNAYDTAAKPRIVTTPESFLSISIYGNYACATSAPGEPWRIYCTKDIKEDSVEWVLVYHQDHVVDDLLHSVELDGSTLCFATQWKLNCANFSTVFKDKKAWSEKKLPPLYSILDISISRKRACLSYLTIGRADSISDCTEDINVKSPVWKPSDPSASGVQINKDKMCGTDPWEYLVCYKDKKRISYDRRYVMGFAIDDTHIVLQYSDSSDNSFFVARFPF